MTDKELFGISEQLETHDKRTETHACDLISKQDAINAICEDGTALERQGRYSLTMAERKQRDADILEALPSAQPDVPDTNVGDMISREAAINSPVKMVSDGLEWVPVYHLKELPLAQSFATDTNVATTDTISRADAIAIVEEVENKRLKGEIDLTYAPMIKGIKALPSAQRWIPVTERLPEDYTDVLVWFEYFRYGDYNRLYQMYGIGSYSAEYDSWMINYETGWRKLRVIAWCPLPEPWKGEEHGTSRAVLSQKPVC